MEMSEAPRPRECHLKKWPHFNGYGFNLHAEKKKSGQFIGAVDVNSPAEAAGLLEGDRIVEVNRVNVNQENHRQVVQRIKAVPGETTLLVVDKKCDEYYRENDIVIKGSSSYVVRLSSEDKNKDNEEEVIDTRLQRISMDDVEREDSENSSVSKISYNSNEVLADGDENTSLHSRSSFDENNKSHFNEHSGPDLVQNTKSTTGRMSGLNLNMTAKEMRERIGSKKKKDIRKENSMDFMRKHEIIQT